MLVADAKPADKPAISFGIGEPKHPTPEFIKQAMTASLAGLASYPSTAGTDALRQAIAGWLERRYGLPKVDAATQVLPVTGSREALFAFAQTVVDASRPNPLVLCPNPFYQIYEGATLLAGAKPVFANSDPARNFAPAFDQIGAETSGRTSSLLYVCSPGNPPAAGDVAGGLEAPVRIVRSPRLRDRLG